MAQIRVKNGVHIVAKALAVREGIAPYELYGKAVSLYDIATKYIDCDHKIAIVDKNGEIIKEITGFGECL